MGATSELSGLLSTHEAAAELQWSQLLELQVAGFLPYELHFLLTSPAWAHVQRVLDAGCGSGYYLAKLRAFFPGKDYCGLDVSPEHIRTARQSSALDGVEFVCADLLDYRPARTFDVIIMRLLLQHLKGLADVFQHLSALVNERGSVIVIEPDPAQFFNFPPTPLFHKLLVDYGAAAAARDLNRGQLENLARGLSEMRGWTLTRQASLVAPSIGPFASSQLLQIFMLWIDIFERSASVTADFGAVRDELERWSRSSATYNQVGLRIVELTRAG